MEAVEEMGPLPSSPGEECERARARVVSSELSWSVTGQRTRQANRQLNGQPWAKPSSWKKERKVLSEEM